MAGIKTKAVFPWIRRQTGSIPGGLIPDRFSGPLTGTLVSGAIGAGLGRFALAPILRLLSRSDDEEEKKLINRRAMLLGGLAGLGIAGIPNYYEYMGRRGLDKKDYRHDPEAQNRYQVTPQYIEGERHRNKQEKAQTKTSSFDSSRMSASLFKPTIPVYSSIQEIESNPWMSFNDKYQARLELARAADKEKTKVGLIRPASLVDFVGKTVSDAAPAMLAAYGISKVLGLPRWARNTAVGTGLLAGAWKSYLEQNN